MPYDGFSPGMLNFYMHTLIARAGLACFLLIIVLILSVSGVRSTSLSLRQVAAVVCHFEGATEQLFLIRGTTVSSFPREQNDSASVSRVRALA